MASLSSDCSHLNPIMDYSNGCYVCDMCGVVLDNIYIQPDTVPSYYNTNLDEKWNNMIKDTLELMHLPSCYTNIIFKKFIQSNIKKCEKELMYTIYKTLNEEKCSIPLKSISALSSVQEKNIYKCQKTNDILVLNPIDMLEKYCKYLELDYKTYSLIKERYLKTPVTGHNPQSVIAAIIYQTCREQKIKKSMKDISTVVQISVISIHRYWKSYIKNELPLRS